MVISRPLFRWDFFSGRSFTVSVSINHQIFLVACISFRLHLADVHLFLNLYST